MTRKQLDDLRADWNKRLFDLRGDLFGDRMARKFAARGMARQRLQTQMDTLQQCINELGAIIDAD